MMGTEAAMCLADFIRNNLEPILAEWEAFATTLLPAAEYMNQLALRDHAQQILEAIAADLLTPQTRHAQAEKSKGRSVRLAGAPETAAETHAVLRANSGFDINQLVAEYRALRASVLRQWMDACHPSPPDLNQVIRFNEAIDQAITESVSFYAARVESSRNLLLGMLGHDMRSPLNTILMTSSYLAALNAGDKVSAAASRLIRSGASLQALLDDLVDFNRCKLGLGITITPADADLAEIFNEELEQLRGAYPKRQLELTVVGNTRGRWDGPRLQRLLRNLVTNAVKYGAHEEPVRVVLTGEEADVRFEVMNHGQTVEPRAMEELFSPLRRGLEQKNASASDGGLGLGLYIVRELAQAHGGEVDSRCTDGKTVFMVRLPRRLDEEPVPATASTSGPNGA
jgi:signal transduction histidine kinase